MDTVVEAVAGKVACGFLGRVLIHLSEQHAALGSRLQQLKNYSRGLVSGIKKRQENNRKQDAEQRAQVFVWIVWILAAVFTKRMEAET